MERVRVCLVGAGRAGLVHGRNLVRLSEAQLVAVVDEEGAARDRACAELGARGFRSLEEALERAAVDAVCVATPTFAHRDAVVLAADAGKHVFCEKPLALTLTQAQEMLQATRRAGVVLQVGFMRRFDPEFRAARECVASGELGRLVFVRSITRGPGLPPRWAWDPAKGIGLLAEVCSHDFDTLRWLSGSEFRSVFARVAVRKAREAAVEQPGFYDVALVTAELEDGTLGSVEGACPVDYGYDARLEVLGTEGMLAVGSVGPGTYTQVTRDGRVVQHTFRSWRDRFQEAYRAEMWHFLQCVREGRTPEVTGLDGLRALEAALAAVESARSGQPQLVGRGGGEP